MLRTSRLLLRPHQVADYDRYVPMWHASETQGGPGPPLTLTPEEAWARLLRFVGHWHHYGWGLFLVEDIANGELVGEVGCALFRRGVGARFDVVPEAAWRVLASRRNQGLALEGMQAALQWMEQEHRVHRTVCMIDLVNTPSLKVAAKLGFREFGQCSYRGHAVALLER
jgi:RimJ/RimL family protein N-acetyltransferase